ncbi:hypothetical protein [Treponema vincentii]|uniref:hypothetical protein n=1 Tax=Treponema vincentii TaxID=69710 RepID=UPI0020A30876|nr:hypothetical protein [Treponema vincentii]
MILLIMPYHVPLIKVYDTGRLLDQNTSSARKENINIGNQNLIFLEAGLVQSAKAKVTLPMF